MNIYNKAFESFLPLPTNILLHISTDILAKLTL